MLAGIAMELLVTLPNVPAGSLSTVADELRQYGAHVVFETRCTGYVESIAGRVNFIHDGQSTLMIFLVLDRGHFPRALLIGGIRQTVSEAVELHLRKTAAHA